MSYGNWVRRLRRRLDLTQTELAHRVGCAPTTIEKIEVDARRPSKAMAERLADALELAPELRPSFLRSARSGVWVDDDAVSSRSPVPPATERARMAGALPVPATPLIGRAREVAAVCDVLGTPGVRVLALIGPGGIGKTRVALQVAADLRASFADGIAFVDLAPLRDPALVSAEIAQALGLPDVGGLPILRRLKAALQGRHLLLVLDNFEHLLSAAQVVADLLAAAPTLKVLLTSRIVVGVYGEHTFVVPPLALPDERTALDLDQLMQVETVRLFVARAQAAQQEFKLTAANAAAVVALCQTLDGLPLAVELAAARMRLFSPQALLQHLRRDERGSKGRRLQVLTGGARTLPARHQALRTTIDLSYELLEPATRRLFPQLAVFVGGWTLSALERVCTCVDGQDLVREVQLLLDSSFVQQRLGVGGEVRFSMLETIREYVLERLVEGGELEGLQQRHAEHFVELAEQGEAAAGAGQPGAWWDRLEEEHGNFRAVLDWSATEGWSDLGLRLAIALAPFWRGRGYLNEGRGWLTRLLQHPGAAVAPASSEAVLAVRATALDWLAVLGGFQGDYSGEEALEESLALFRALGDRAKVAAGLGDLGMLLQLKGEEERAQRCLEESLMLARELGNDEVLAATLFFLGTLAFGQGNTAEAGGLWEESLKRFEALEHRWFEAVVRMHLAMISVEQDEEGQAIAQGAESLRFFRELGDHAQIVHALEVIGGAAVVQGRRSAADRPFLVRAARLLGAAEAVRETEGLPIMRYIRRFHKQACCILGTNLVDDARVEAWMEGRGMLLEEAIAYALKECES